MCGRKPFFNEKDCFNLKKPVYYKNILYESESGYANKHTFVHEYEQIPVDDELCLRPMEVYTHTTLGSKTRYMLWFYELSLINSVNSEASCAADTFCL